MKKEELDAVVANEIRSLGFEGVFNEETLNKIKESTLARMQEDIKLVENEEVVMQDDNMEVNLEKAPESTEVSVSYTPELPSFMDKIEPAKFIVFDRNELSVGGENLSNKPFRTLENPDIKKSVHDTWIKEGKKRADVYIAKFVKIGEIEFNYQNGISQYIEKIDEKPAMDQNGMETGSFETFKPLVVTDKTAEERTLESQIKTSLDLENKVKEYIEHLVRDNYQSSNVGKISDPNVRLQESNYKMREVVMNNKKFKKIDTPEELKMAISEGKGKAKLISKNDDVQVWLLEGNEYILSSNIISNKKCYTKITKTL